MELPRFVEIEQKLHGRRVGDIPAAVARACEEAGLRSRVAPGDTVAITVGSRGIANIAEIAAAVVRVVKDLGGQPFLLPAMGSHGGATAEGQTELLASLGVTPASVGAPMRADMTVEQIGETSNGVARLRQRREALRADRVIVMNRVKQHTDFDGEYESGLMKMLAIGVGKRDGAMAMHARLLRQPARGRPGGGPPAAAAPPGGRRDRASRERLQRHRGDRRPCRRRRSPCARWT